MKKLIFFIVFYICFCNISFSKEVLQNSNTINITSNKVDIFRNKKEIIFIGNVIVTKDNFKLYTDLMTVKYKEDNNKKTSITDVIAKNNVRFVSEKVDAFSDDGIYKPSKNLIILKNNVKAIENGITVFADEFEYNTITKKTKIIGNKKQQERVTIILDDIDNLKNRD